MSDANAGNSAEASMEVEENESLKMAMELSLAPDLPSHQVGKGVPAGFRGIYELHGIVTHKGRSADSGHYIGWVRQSPGSSYWWCFNDDKVTEVRTEDILLLRGGGDREMAYLNFYRFKE